MAGFAATDGAPYVKRLSTRGGGGGGGGGRLRFRKDFSLLPTSWAIAKCPPNRIGSTFCHAVLVLKIILHVMKENANYGKGMYYHAK